MTGTSWDDMPSEIHERLVKDMPQVAGMFRLGSLCSESRCRAAEMAHSLIRTLDTADLPPYLKRSCHSITNSSTHSKPSSLSTIRSLLHGTQTEYGSSKVYLDPLSNLLFSRSQVVITPPAEKRASPEEDLPTTVIPRHLDSPLVMTRALSAKALHHLSKLEPLLGYFPTLAQSKSSSERVRELIRGALSTVPGYALSWEPSTDSLCFHVAAAQLKTGPKYQVHKQVNIPGSRFPSSLHLETAANFVSPFDVKFPFPIPEGQASLNWVTARECSSSEAQNDKVFGQYEFPGEVCSTVNLSNSPSAASAEGRTSTSLSTVLLGEGKKNIWEWTSHRAAKLRVKGKDGWAAKHQGELCIYGKGAQGLYLDSITLMVQC